MDSVLFAGAQDQGTQRYRGEQTCYEGPLGDGGGVAVDPNNPRQVMRQYVNAGLSVSTDAGSSGNWSGLDFPPVGASPSKPQLTAKSTENSSTAFYSPIAVTPIGVSPTLTAFGTNRLWLTPDWGSTWTTLPTNNNPYAGAGPDYLSQDVLDGGPIIAVAFASATRIFAATPNGVWQYDYDAASAVWSKAQIPALPTPPMPTPQITALAVENAATPTFYLALGGGGQEHVWYFDGANWQKSGLLAVVDAPTQAIAIDPNNTNILYVGTDVGVYQGTKTGASWSWTIFSQGLPEAAVTDLAIHQQSRLLRAATHGRGVWEITLDALLNPDPDVYVRANYADSGRLQNGSRMPWIEGADDPTSPGNAIYHWMSADIKVRRPGLQNLPQISAQSDFVDFAVNIGDLTDPSTGMETGDFPGTTDRIFIEVHNRSLTTPLAGGQVQVLLLLADASAALPALPDGYAGSVTGASSDPAWLGPDWHFADPTTPYRSLPGQLDARTPQVVWYDVDLASMGLTPGDDHVCALALITAAGDALNAQNTNVDELVMTDKHVALRNLHLVTLDASPVAGGGPSPGSPRQTAFVHNPRTFVLDFNNATTKETVVDLVFSRSNFPGHMSLMFTPLTFASASGQSSGITVAEKNLINASIAEHLGRWLESIGELVEDVGEGIERLGAALAHDARERHRQRRKKKLRELDRSMIYVADNSPNPMLGGVRLGPGARITAAVTIQAPPDAVPGDRYRIDCIQRSAGRIIGGSSYVAVVRKVSGVA
jgi:hypothetical protein